MTAYTHYTQLVLGRPPGKSYEAVVTLLTMIPFGIFVSVAPLQACGLRANGDQEGNVIEERSAK